MVLAVLADDWQKEELIRKGIPEHCKLMWADSVRALVAIEADVYMDLLFSMDKERTERLGQLPDKAIFINSVTSTTRQTGYRFIRINAWPGMLQRPLLEIAISEPDQEQPVKDVFEALKWKFQLVPDIAGMITPRVLASIINEAWFTLGDGVSSREEIDTAMKLGTNYPIGPFEWCAKIGLERIFELLTELSKEDKRYQPAPALEKEVWH